MRLPRLKTRRLIALVAIAAMGMGTIVSLARRRDSFLAQAACHRKLSNEALVNVTLVHQRHHFTLSEPERAEAEAYERRGTHHAKLQAKYERAARYPWLPVPPDPPFVP